MSGKCGTSPRLALLLYDLGVSSSGCRRYASLPFRLMVSRQIRQLVVHRFVIADHDIRFPIAQDRDRATALDAGRGALRVLVASRAVIRIASGR
jgi:hypothetical protein